MIGVCLLAMLSTTSFAAITRAPSTNSTSRSTPLSISPKLRKALIEALNNYDPEDSTEVADETTTFSTTTDEIEAETTTDTPTFIKIHTFSIDGDNSNENEVIKTIIITRPKTTLTPPKTEEDQVQIKFGKSPDPINEESDKSDNAQQVRSVESRKSLNSSVDKKEEKPKKKASEKAVTKTPVIPLITTPSTVATSSTNADGKNVEKVAKDGVKIQQAPLLAAFTVQQDANGHSQKVISLLRNPQVGKLNKYKDALSSETMNINRKLFELANTQSTADGKRIVNLQFRASQPESTQTFTTTTSTIRPTSLASSLAPSDPSREIIKSFEDKQRLLEEQIRLLTARQREQDEIIRRHHLLQDQISRQKFEQQRIQFEEDQRQRQFEDQRRRQRAEQEQQVQRQQIIQAQIAQQPQAQALIAPPSNTISNVQVIPSIPIGHTVGISVEQQPPFKDAIEFHPESPNLQKTIQRFQFRQFQQQQQRNNAAFTQPQQQQNQQTIIQKVEVQQLPASSLPTNLELPLRNAQTFNQISSLPTTLELPQKQFQQFSNQNVLQPLADVAAQSQTRPRVFRNDALQTGNHGFNTNNNNVFIQQQPLRSLDQSIDNQLFNQFLQHGISTRSAEDFRIISKILSYNHGTDPNINQQLLFANTQG